MLAQVYTILPLRFLRPFILALLIAALPLANASAAIISTNLTTPNERHASLRGMNEIRPTSLYGMNEPRQIVQQTIKTIEPALHKPIQEVLPSALQIGLDTGSLNAEQYANYYQVLVGGKAPANQPEIAHLLSLPPEEQITYSLQRLQQMGKLNAKDVQLFTALRSAPAEEIRDRVVTALENGGYGVLATAILQVAVSLTDVDASKLEACDSTSSNVQAQGGGFFKWLGGLVLAVIGGALIGALTGAIFGYGLVGSAIWGGIRGGGLYILATLPSGFMPGPNGEDCTGWPRPI